MSSAVQILIKLLYTQYINTRECSLMMCKLMAIMTPAVSNVHLSLSYKAIIITTKLLSFSDRHTQYFKSFLLYFTFNSIVNKFEMSTSLYDCQEMLTVITLFHSSIDNRGFS